MTKRYSVLQAKLQELESKLHDALLLPPDPDDDQNQDQPHHTTLFEDIKKKIAFVNTLLSAEIKASSTHIPPLKSQHLQHMAERLARSEELFLEWKNFRTLNEDRFEMGSACSCTESCFNDDGEAAGADPENFSEGFVGVGEKLAMVEWEGGPLVYEDAEDHFLEGLNNNGDLVRKRGLEEEGKDITVREEKIRDISFGQICGAMAGGVVVGMVLMGFMMLRYSGCFHFVEQPCFTIPT